MDTKVGIEEWANEVMMGMKGKIEREKVMRERVYGRYRRWDSGETSERIERENGFGWYIYG